MTTQRNRLGSCPQFAFVAEFADELRAHDCVVCGGFELTHRIRGRRGITLAQAREERLALIKESEEMNSGES
jgi:hypothetical protein